MLLPFAANAQGYKGNQARNRAGFDFLVFENKKPVF